MTAPTAAELAAVPMFASLTAAELEEAARLFTIRSYPKDTIVATEGDRLELFNVILSGAVQGFWRDEAGHQLKLGTDGPGGHIVDSTLSGEPSLVSVIVVDDVRFASIPVAELKRLVLRHPQVGLVLLMEVVGRLRRLQQRTKILTMEDVYGRVVKLLLARAKETDDTLVAEGLTHAEIGQKVAATREMVGRVLRDLARGGYVKVNRGRITILRKLPSRW